MAQINLVEGSPNEKVLSISIEGIPLLTDLSRVVFSNAGKMKEHSKLAQAIFTRYADLNAFTIIRDKENASRCLVTAQLPDGKTKEDFFGDIRAILEAVAEKRVIAVDEKAISSNFEILSEFNPSAAGIKNYQKIAAASIAHEAAEKSQKDGGDIVTLDIWQPQFTATEVVEVDGKAQFRHVKPVMSKVVLLGACSGCEAAPIGTLNRARQTMANQFHKFSKDNPEIGELQNLLAMPIEFTEPVECAIK